MANIFGTEVPIGFEISGFMSNTWGWVLLVVVIGLILIGVTAALLFLRTYNRRIILFENVAGVGYQPTLKTRARIIKVGTGGGEVLKTLAGGHYVSAYGRKMGKNTYWFCKGPDGYWYNIILGDLDTKLGMLDIDPIDRDVRMFHISVDRLARATYDKMSIANKLLIYGLPILMIIIFFVGFYILIGRISEATAPLGETTRIQEQVAETNLQITERLGLIVERLTKGGSEISLNPDIANSGLSPAPG